MSSNVGNRLKFAKISRKDNCVRKLKKKKMDTANTIIETF